MSENLPKLTPLMQQYWEIKSAHPDKILLFRMGDFYEMFHRDAEIAAPILGIALTSRNKKAADETRMCGVPHHSIAGPINKLLAAGLRVAICDQIEDPKLAKGIVKRAVTRILSPGVVYDPDTLDALQPNYLVSSDARHLSFLDASTGENFYYEITRADERDTLLRVLSPVEWVASPDQLAHLNFSGLVTEFSSFAEVEGPESLRRLYAYLRHMQGESALLAMQPPEKRELHGRLELSPATLRHLEVFETYKGELVGGLFHALNRCKTSAGARRLREWLRFPLASKAAIVKRQNAILHWRTETETLKKIRELFGQMGDVERRLAKIANPTCHPRDLLALCDSLTAGLEIVGLTQKELWLSEHLQSAVHVVGEVARIVEPEPPAVLKNGYYIRRGVSAHLDELIELSTNSQQMVLNLEARERELTGISSLKIRFNNIFGYYIEITNTHKDKVPSDRYQRKQTLANAERFLTKELEELEQKVLTAQVQRVELESQFFADLRADILSRASALLRLARTWSELDVLTSLAWLSLEQNYVQPTLVDEGALELLSSRHPVVEQVRSQPFVANDIRLAAHHCLLLTGPNMAGKSTLMRQVAVTVIMAQMGSFVPAQYAQIPLCDRIFTRIGASDYLNEGLSTFMVEMQEVAEMLRHSTPRSLVVLDEVGRGTSTFDGMSLAQAILEHLLSHTRALTFFATHYHELTRLSENFAQLQNAHMAIQEKGGHVTFLHTMVAGPANKSYGIHVAKLAGLPMDVLKRAAQILKDMEAQAQPLSPQLSLDWQSSEAAEPVLHLSPEEKVLLAQLKDWDTSQHTPLAALNQIAQWQRELS